MNPLKVSLVLVGVCGIALASCSQSTPGVLNGAGPTHPAKPMDRSNQPGGDIRQDDARGVLKATFQESGEASPPSSENASLQTIPADFVPDGTWQVTYTKEAVGRSFTTDSDKPIVGRTFDPAAYLTPDFVGNFKDTTLTITFDPNTKILTLSGGDFSGAPRELKNPADMTGLFFTSVNGILSDRSEVVSGCNQVTGWTEWIRFRDSSTLVYYGQDMISFFEADVSNPGACAPVLAQLGNQLSAGTAPPFFMALKETGALDLGKIQLFDDGEILYFYDGKRQ